jgi:hypothetical protein
MELEHRGGQDAYPPVMTAAVVERFRTTLHAVQPFSSRRGIATDICSYRAGEGWRAGGPIGSVRGLDYTSEGAWAAPTRAPTRLIQVSPEKTCAVRQRSQKGDKSCKRGGGARSNQTPPR